MKVGTGARSSLCSRPEADGGSLMMLIRSLLLLENFPLPR